MGSKPKCEVEGCEKQQWKDHCCMVHFKEKHGIERKKSGPKNPFATTAAKILPPPVIKVRERCAPVIMRSETPHLSLRGTESRSNLGSGQSHIIDALIKQRGEHRQALIELEAILNGISKYGGVIIPE